MINFTVGPVQSSEEVRAIGTENTPYFRTAEFSAIMLENEKMLLKLAKAPKDSRIVFLTGSGTAAMEAAVINTLTKEDKALVVNGGGFGERFVELCELHKVPHEAIELEAGKTLTADDLARYDGQGYTAFLVNLDETSTGVLYHLDLIHDFCKRNNIYLIVDAISSFLADHIDMERYGIDLMLTGSQKALAVPPGISIVFLTPTALERVERIESGCMYLDFSDALKNGERGQTPFTPAVTILLQIHKRLCEIEEQGGAESEVARIEGLAKYFREKVKAFPFEIFTDSPSNAVTSLYTKKGNAKEIFELLKNEYGIWICPNGGDIGNYLFRVGHIGNLTTKDYDELLDAFGKLQERGVI